MDPKLTEIWDPEVPVVNPGHKYGDAPSDAIVLFDGTNLDEWKSGPGDATWPIANDFMTVVDKNSVAKGQAGISTKRKFGSVQLHLEWRTPPAVGNGQKRGNSGVFFSDGRYEVQILDNYNNRTYKNGQAASIYKQSPPLVNACRKPEEWQSYDIIYMAPSFNKDGSYLVPPTITVLHNGVLVQNAFKLRGPTKFRGIPEYFVKPHGDGSIHLQNHGNPVSYRNIWVREL
ncbi:3-keto-disaccharide hydrolase [Reichenbachiella versicolor]|uniref:3-keto-disaccharide hydrolase n=1 Tax=Reichenbachiella versicolor TaxID=1821036 RepID=UPI001FEB097A|nr:DUF1080 domain-containing protein [Reichenbachiella versicolor]